MQGLALTLGFAAVGAQHPAARSHFDPQPVWSSRFEQVKMLPLHRTGLWTPESSQELPCRCHNSPQAWMFPEEGLEKNLLCLDEGRKGFPKDHPVSFVRSSKTHFKALLRNLVTAETTKVIQDNRSSQCKSHSGCRECTQEIHLSVLCLPV